MADMKRLRFRKDIPSIRIRRWMFMKRIDVVSNLPVGTFRWADALLVPADVAVKVQANLRARGYQIKVDPA